MAHFFIFSSSCPPFNTFRDDAFLQMMNDVSGENEFKPLTIPHLKIFLNAEHNTFKKASRQEVLDHHEEANQNQFCQFPHDGTTLLNECNHQAFGMQCVDAKFRHNSVIAFSFRTPLSQEAEKVAELSEEVCTECFDLEFNHVFSSSEKDLGASTVAKELNEEKVECYMCQGEKWVLVLSEN